MSQMLGGTVAADAFTQIMAAFGDDDGRLGRATHAQVGLPEKIQRADTRLAWLPRGKITAIEPADAVWRFIRLADEGEIAILDFARSYGPLWVCKRHHIAAFHPPIFSIPGALGPSPAMLDDPRKPTIETLNCPIETLRDGWLAEPLETWRQLSLRARNLLTAAARLKAGKSVSDEQWQAVDGFSEDWSQLGVWAYLSDPWWRLAENLNWWLSIAQAMPFVAANQGSLRTSIGTPMASRRMPSVLAVIAVQLIFACQGQSDFTTCAGCGQTYLPRRKPMAGKRVGPHMAKRNYCDTCRGHVSVRNAKADQRTRDREIWNLVQQGAPIPRIAKSLKMDPDRVDARIRKIRSRKGRIV